MCRAFPRKHEKNEVWGNGGEYVEQSCADCSGPGGAFRVMCHGSCATWAVGVNSSHSRFTLAGEMEVSGLEACERRGLGATNILSAACVCDNKRSAEL